MRQRNVIIPNQRAMGRPNITICAKEETMIDHCTMTVPFIDGWIEQ
ncbi:MAG: hypothetical protein LUQ71_00845 [Methanoregula sp.]|nr:hypothetical protein [Methanoregula sp.]